MVDLKASKQLCHKSYLLSLNFIFFIFGCLSFSFFIYLSIYLLESWSCNVVSDLHIVLIYSFICT